MSEFSRRDFLRAVTLAGTAAAAAGCSSESARKLIPYIIPPEDIVPGEATWYATTCRECPAGCGILAKNREGRVIKVEGNPLHPINQGKLCPRGQASLQGLYDPDRIRGPMKKNPQGLFESVSWDQAQKEVALRVREVLEKGRGDGIFFLTELNTGALKDLMSRWLGELGSENYLPYEPYSYEPLRKANQLVFGVDGIPSYRLDQADFLLSFGADFLETWLSNVEYARQFASFHESENRNFVYVGPRISLTAANADRFIPLSPGEEYLVALGVLRVILDENLSPALPPPQKSGLQILLKDWTLSAIASKSGVKEMTLRTLAQQLSRARKPLALAGSGLLNPTETATAANLLCSLVPGSQEIIDWENLSSLSAAVPAGRMKELTARMKKGEVRVLMIHRANPLFSLPPSWEFAQALKNVPLVVSFSSTLDETGELAHILLPSHTPLESWGDFSPRKNVRGLMQPVMGPLFDTRHVGDVLLHIGKAVKGPEKFPWESYFHYLRHSWDQERKKKTPPQDPEAFWRESVRKGGIWEAKSRKPSAPSLRLNGFSFPPPQTEKPAGESLRFIAYPTIQFFDGREANRPWLQELPDPITQVTWGSWVEIHPDTARNLGIRKGDLLRLKSPAGTVEVPAYPYSGIRPDTLAMPIGQGHAGYGRFARTQPGNPYRLLSPELDRLSGGLLLSLAGLILEKENQNLAVANTDGSLYQHERGFVQSISQGEYQKKKNGGEKPPIRVPLPGGYDRKEDFYPPHEHKDYRWAMAVDLDRCIGCGACAVACIAENNVAIVGREQVLKGREMSWLRVERYFEPEGLKESPPLDRLKIRFLPMLCQHCDNAPCEPVCPVFAPHHSKEGLNNQVYNRCIGTRFCSQNCPYKVRRFNFFTYTRPEPLNWQLNPDVTVRQKGVMEKCSFCVQRIKEAQLRAKYEGRKVRDGEVLPACVQTCPADALIFGNLMDPKSRISQLIQDPRAYQVLEYLNTKPAVIYLKKVTKELKL